MQIEMPDWFVQDASSDLITLKATELILRLMVGALAGFVVAGVYRKSHGADKGEDAWTMSTTLVLLSLLVAMVSMVIGNSVARAFSLVGALSIVRFRTVVEDTRDTAFVIFAVIVGMASGAGYFLIPVIGIPITSAVAFFMHVCGKRARAKDTACESLMRLTIRIGLGKDPNQILKPLLDQHVVSFQLLGVSTVKQGASIEVNYRLHMNANANPLEFVSKLNMSEGVHGVELQAF